MSKQQCIAMLLAGGQGSRLGALTGKVAKPAVSFGGKFRIIDFALSNCSNSGISTVGVLTQYRPYLLHSYLGTGEAWNLDERGGGVSILPPYATQEGGAWYEGTADAVAQNIGYIESYDPDYVLILSGDQLYRMDYHAMLQTHIRHNADLTISVMPVAWEEASRFGIITKDDDDRVVKFTEKPAEPDSNLASMGIYIFSTDVLLDKLRADADNPNSSHDFGNDIIPEMLASDYRIYCHEFNGYWRDVGTIASFHETSMELLGENPAFDLYTRVGRIMSNASTRPPAFIGPKGKVDDSLVSNGAQVCGNVKHSIISTDCYVGEGAEVTDSIMLPGARVEEGARVVRAILGEKSCIQAGATFGTADEKEEFAVIGDEVVVGKGE
ncbi:MAG: glucose-1-phosphate adenylyltransferase [Atopobiaceae bacterium]|nr:glucose-1-phosphate adenylyltransferase [Atopobiaceae bacterium]